MEKDDAFAINEKELMEYYHYSGTFGKFKLRLRFLRTWILHSIAYSSPLPNFVILLQRARGVKIGKDCHFSPYVLLDLLYPELITIEDNVTVASNVMIFAHVNQTTNLFLKTNGYPRVVNPINIRSGAIIGPGSIITAGVTVGQNSIVGVGSVVNQDVPDYCVVLGNPARIIKQIEH